jgi:hypothetical protein
MDSHYSAPPPVLLTLILDSIFVLSTETFEFELLAKESMYCNELKCFWRLSSFHSSGFRHPVRIGLLSQRLTAFTHL